MTCEATDVMGTECQNPATLTVTVNGWKWEYCDRCATEEELA